MDKIVHPGGFRW